jgi:CRP/FNR family transcriptional regulator
MFKMLSIEELQVIKDSRINIHYRRGEIIQKQGTFMSHAISVNAGLVKVYLENEGHSDTILRIVPPTNFIGGPGIYYDQLYHFSISALKDSSICLIDLNVFKSILDQNKAFAAEFMSDFSKSVISTYNRLIKLTKNNLPGRVAYALLYLFEEVYERKENTISITKHDLADLSAISRESVSKILRDFQSGGIIRFSSQEVELLKPDILQQIRSLG